MSKSIWKTVKARVRGSSHEKSCTLCQDFFSTENISPSTLCIVVADGAGSAQFSHIGAKAACEGIISYIQFLFESKENINQDDLIDAVISTRNWVISIARGSNKSPREYASTLLVLILTPQKALWAHIGDGGIVCKSMNHPLTVLSLPEKGEYANETGFLTDVSLEKNLRVGEQISDSSFYSAALFSDGIERLVLDIKTGQPYELFFNPLFKHVSDNLMSDSLDEELVKFLSSERMRERSDDDRTLVLAVLSNENETASSEIDGSKE